MGSYKTCTGFWNGMESGIYVRILDSSIVSIKSHNVDVVLRTRFNVLRTILTCELCARSSLVQVSHSQTTFSFMFGCEESVVMIS